MKTLPVTAAFSHAMRSTLDNLGFAFHLSWPWMLALFPIEIVGNLYIWANDVGPPDVPNPKVIAATFIMGIASLIAFSSIAVSWHRYILRDDMPQGLGRLRLDATVWRYAGNVLLIVLLLSLCVVPAVFAFALVAVLFGDNALVIIVPASLLLLLAIIPSSYRLSVKLPAIALERWDYSLRNAWADTRGNFWQLLGLALLYFLLVLIAGLVAAGVGYGLGQLAGAIGQSVSIAIQLVVNWIVTILGVTMLTSLYGYFVEGREF